METSTPTWKLLRLPVGFALVTGVLLIIAWATFGGSIPLAPQGYRVAIPVGDASNLVPGSDVQISGVTIGHVSDIGRDANGAIANTDLDPATAPLPKDVVAIVRTKTLLGEGYIELSPGTADGGTIPDGGTIAARQVKPRVQLDEFLRTFNPRTREGVQQLVAGLATAHRDRGPDLSAAIARFAPTAAGIGDVLDVLDARRGDLRTAISGSAGVFDALGEREGALRSAVSAANQMFEATDARGRQLAATIRSLPPFLSQLDRTARTIESASGPLNQAAIALRSAAPRIRPALRAIKSDAPEFRRLFADLPETERAAEGGVPALRELARESLPTLRTLYPAMREINPALALLSANSQELMGVMSNLGSILNARLLGPGNISLPNAAATVFLSNETLLGYKSRLPTNRLNPYIRPGGLREMAKRGHLLSYDCRNVNNPLIVPVIGFGAPPCEEQGPWKFQGEKEFFPRLERAAP